PILPLTDSRSPRVWVARGSIEYSAVTQPRPESLRQRGTPTVTLAATSTRVRPNSTSTEPSAWSSQLRVMRTSRSCSGVRPSWRGVVSVMPVRLTRRPGRTLTAVEKIADIDLPGGATTVLHAAAAEDPHAPVVLVLPAMGVPAGYYGPFVDELARTGVTAAVADYTGQAESRPRAGRGRDLGYDDLAHGWLPAVVAELRRERPGPVVALGHSLGGHLLAAHLSDGEPVVDAGVLIGSGTPHWRALHGLKTLAQAQLIGVVSRALGYWPGERLGFGGTQPRTLIREWAAFSRTGRLAPRGRDVADGLRGHSLPLLVVDLEGDTLAPR